MGLAISGDRGLCSGC